MGIASYSQPAWRTSSTQEQFMLAQDKASTTIKRLVKLSSNKFGIDGFNQAIKKGKRMRRPLGHSINHVNHNCNNRSRPLPAPSSCQGRTSEEEKAVRVKVTVPWWAKRGEKGKGVDPRSVKVKSEVTEGESRWCVVEVSVKLVLLMNFSKGRMTLDMY